MSIYESITKGLNEAIEYEKGNLKDVRRRVAKIVPLPNYSADEIRAIRLELNLSQSTFANVLGVSQKTVEAWEAGKNIPYGPALRMMDILKNEHQLVEKYVVSK
jgi:putative transcriptional regulator